MSTADPWASVLDELEVLIGRQRDVLDHGGEGDVHLEAVRFLPPTGLPPLPPQHVPRARRLLHETHRLAARAAAVPSPRARPHRPTNRRTATRLDMRA